MSKLITAIERGYKGTNDSFEEICQNEDEALGRVAAVLLYFPGLVINIILEYTKIEEPKN